MTKHAFRLLLVLCLMTGSLWAATDPLAGKWKLDPSRSKLFDEMKVRAVGPNKYDFIFSGDNVETVVVDGTDQPGLYGSTLAVTADGPDSWKVVRKTNGKIEIVGLWKLSDHDSTLTDSFTSYHANGSMTNLHYTYKRSEGKSGFAGTWDSVTEQVNSTFEIEIRPYESDGLSIVYPASEQIKSVKFDGQDYSTSGANIPAGYKTSAKRLDERTVEMTNKMDGKVMDAQKIELSAEGNTLTITTMIPGRSKPNIQVFDRE